VWPLLCFPATNTTNSPKLAGEVDVGRGGGPACSCGIGLWGRGGLALVLAQNPEGRHL
jgi:hypothetical protein